MLLAAGLGVGVAVNDGAPAATTADAAAEPTLPAGEVVVEMAYDPGQSSGWHIHPIEHTVLIRSGTLAVYDDACEVRLYGTGETYAGGTQRHLVRNEGAVAVEMTVSRIETPIATYSVARLPAPAGCTVD